MKPVTLPPSHYAFGWKIDMALRPIEEITAMGCRYADLADGAEKEDQLLDLCQCFHPYLMKYLVMICRGHKPIPGHGVRPTRINKDIRPFLMYFLEKGQQPSSMNLSKVARTLHLAFKGMEAEEIYDVLMEHLINTLKGYDPHYKLKVKRVVETINDEFSKTKQFTAADVNRHLDIDSNRYRCLLGRIGVFARSRKTAWKKDPLPPLGHREGFGAVRYRLGQLSAFPTNPPLYENFQVSWTGRS